MSTAPTHTTWHLPPEWAEQDAVLLTWPHAGTDWAEAGRENLARAEQVWRALAQAIVPRQGLVVVAHDAELAVHIAETLGADGVDLSQVRIVVAPCDDTWARDHGPLVCLPDSLDVSAQVQVHDYVFNGWGGKFDAELDDAVVGVLAEAGLFAGPVRRHDLIMEGGSLEVDAHRALLTTTACLENPNRNPHLSRAEIEAALREALGVRQIHWLTHGHLEGDDTDSHIDTLARFAPDGSIVFVGCDDPSDSHYADLQGLAAELAALRDHAGASYVLRPLPWPAARFHPDDAHRLPATYANYLVINGAVLVPVYGDAKDAEALAVVAAGHPGREVIGIDCQALIEQGGSLHCITMQLPKGTLRQAFTPRDEEEV